MATAAVTTREQYKELQNKLEELTMCSICRERFKNPKILNCHHTFCCQCLQSYFDQSNDGSAPCPLCRCPFSPPSHDVSNLPTSTFMQDVVMMIDRKSPIMKKCCMACKREDEDAEFMCVECDIQICESCVNIHEKFRTDSHHVLRLDEITDTSMIIAVIAGKKTNRSCEKHPGKILEHLCISCNVPMCSVCKSSDHRRHLTQNMFHAAEETRNMIKNVLKDTYPEITFLTDTITNIKSRSASMQISTDAMTNEIRSYTDSMIQVLRDKEKLLLEGIASDFASRQKELKNLEEVAEMQLTCKKSFLDYVKSLETFGNASQLSVANNTIRKRLEELKQDEPPKMPTSCFCNQKFKPSDVLARLNSESIGSIENFQKESEDKPPPIPPRGSRPQHIPQSPPSVVPLSTGQNDSAGGAETRITDHSSPAAMFVTVGNIPTENSYPETLPPGASPPTPKSFIPVDVRNTNKSEVAPPIPPHIKTTTRNSDPETPPSDETDPKEIFDFDHEYTNPKEYIWRKSSSDESLVGSPLAADSQRNPQLHKSQPIRPLPPTPEVNTSHYTSSPSLSAPDSTYLKLYPETRQERLQRTMSDPRPLKERQYKSPLDGPAMTSDWIAFDTKIKISGLAITRQDEIVVVGNKSKQCLVFNADGTLKNAITEQVVKPWDVAVSQTISGPDETVFLTDTGEKSGNGSVKEYMLDGTYITTLVTNLRKPHGIAASTSGDIYVCDAEDSSVVVIPRGGGSVRKIKQNALGVKMFMCPWYVSASTDDVIVISDFTAGKLVSVNAKTGKKIKSYKPDKSVMALEFRPAMSCIDKDCNIFVVDQISNGIYMWTARKKLTRLSVPDGMTIDRPVALALDSSGDLWLGCRKGALFKVRTCN